MPPSPPLPVEAYLEAALEGDTASCLKLATAALEAGHDIRGLYTGLFQAAQYRVGELWAANRITVGTEHRATATTQVVIATLYDRIVQVHGHGRRMLMACVGREIHQLGARMVADFAELEGWDVSFLGTVRSPEELIAAIREQQPEVVGLSATLVVHLADVQGYVQAIIQAFGDRRPRIVVGGRAFRLVPDAWRKVGADGSAEDAHGAVEALGALA